MKKETIKYGDIYAKQNIKSFNFPKYTTQIMNLANQNAQGTRPKIVGKMSDLIQEFRGETINEWKEWYSQKKAGAMNDAVERVYSMVESLKEAIEQIDKAMIKNYIEDLVINKTFTGMRIQNSILQYLGEKTKKGFSIASSQDESMGIDGYIGDIPVSIKPVSYKTMNNLSEQIPVNIIFYEKNKTGIIIEYEPAF